jgi:hypothetical protein
MNVVKRVLSMPKALVPQMHLSAWTDPEATAACAALGLDRHGAEVMG